MVEHLKQKYHKEWFEEEGDHYPIRVSIMKDEVYVYMDTSGDSLHKRGYRLLNGKAPISETLAAALILSGLAAGIWRSLPPSSFGRTAFWTLLLAGTSAAILGGWGLVKARISDRRWRSLYILGLTVLAECVLILSVCVSINLDACSPHWWTSFAVDCSILGLIGLAGGGGKPYVEKGPD